jgi:hypothetical protein
MKSIILRKWFELRKPISAGKDSAVAYPALAGRARLTFPFYAYGVSLLKLQAIT